LDEIEAGSGGRFGSLLRFLPRFSFGIAPRSHRKSAAVFAIGRVAGLVIVTSAGLALACRDSIENAAASLAWSALAQGQLQRIEVGIAAVEIAAPRRRARRLGTDRWGSTWLRDREVVISRFDDSPGGAVISAARQFDGRITTAAGSGEMAATH
jgi:hypothetical protein